MEGAFWTRWRTARRLLVAANRARDRRDWAEASRLYRAYVSRRPLRSAIWVQLGHALGEQGAIAGAEDAYLAATLAPDADADAYFHFGRVLRNRGELKTAVSAFAAALRLDRQCSPAFLALLQLGAAGEVEHATAAWFREMLNAERMAAVAGLADAEWRLAAYGGFLSQSFDDFRKEHGVGAAPVASALMRFELVVVDARWAGPGDVQATLSSLIAQHDPLWRAFVRCGPELEEHPVASLAHIDSRIHFSFSTDTRSARDPVGEGVLLVRAGVVLDPHALGWFRHAASISSVEAIYADHEYGEQCRTGAILRTEPRLFWCHDSYYIKAAVERPVTVYLRSLSAEALVEADFPTAEDGVAAAKSGLHIPRLLSMVLRTEKGNSPATARKLESASHSSGGVPHRTIRVIIPTRNSVDLVDACVQSLSNTASSPVSFKVTLVDNRSGPAERDEWRQREAAGHFEVVTFDEPFNWSRASNIGAARASEDIFLFLNNDTEMLSQGWDDELRAALQDESLGAVGARLLYPNHAIQHAGIILGMGEGLPLHEGVGPRSDYAADRTDKPHLAAAVTGAFLATRRSTFSDLNGFDENLIVAYNDVDFCFRVRDAGLGVLYQPAITLLHHESLTRGYNMTDAQIAWDQSERNVLFARWPTGLSQDPSINPYWSRRGVPFSALREPASSEIEDYVRRGAKARPWAVS